MVASIRDDVPAPIVGCSGMLCLEHRDNLTPQLRDAILDDVPDKFVVHTEIIVNQAIAHSRHGPPLNGRVLPAKLLGHFLGRFSDNLEAPNKCTPKRLVRHEFVARQAGRLGDQVICLHQDMAKVITRLERNPALPPEFAAR